jgi:hypothetical protein
MVLLDFEDWPIKPDTVRIIYELHCLQCGTVCQQQWVGCDPGRPVRPIGWTFTEPDGWLCPEHAVTAEVG